MRCLVLGVLACTLLVGAGPPDQQCPQMYFEGTPPAVLRSSAANEGRIFCHSFYAVSYSSTRKDPLWSAEHLTGDMARGGDAIGRVNKQFAQQVGLTAARQGKHHDYDNTGYDRGHMTPANDAQDMTSQKDTFVVTNIVPQTKPLNEHLWAWLEAAVHRLAEDDGEIYIVTGPIFGDAPKLLNQRVQVPAATFKAVYNPAAGTGIAFIASNDTAPACVTVSLAELAARAGVDPFPGLTAAVKNAAPTLQLKPGLQFKAGHPPTQLPLPGCPPG